MESEKANEENENFQVIQNYQDSNYLELYKENEYCDFYINQEWNVGIITSLQEDSANIKKVNFEGSKNVNLKDPTEISYFRHYTNQNTKMENIKKEDSEGLHEIYLKLEEIKENNFEKLKKMKPYSIIQFYRGQLFIGLDKVLNYGGTQKDLKVSLKILYLYYDFIIYALQFYKDHCDVITDYFENQNTQYIDIIIVDQSFAMISTFFETLLMLRKIVTITSFSTLFFYCNYNFFKLYNNKNLDLLPCGVKNICKEEMYNIKKTIERKIADEIYKFNNLQIAKFIDYFCFKGGYSLLTEIIISKNDYNLNFLYQLISIFQIYTNYLNTDDTSIENNVDIILKYIQNKLDNFTKNDLQDYNLKSIIIFLTKVDEIIPQRKVFEQLYLLYFYKCLTSDILEKQILGINSLCKIIINIKNKRNSFITFSQFTDIRREKEEKIENSFAFKMNFNEIVNFFNDKGIVNIIFGENVHEEINKRSFEIITMMYLCKWGIKDDKEIEERNKKVFQFLWNRAMRRKSESLRKYMKNYLTHFAQYLSIGHKLILFKKLKQEIVDYPISKEIIVFIKDFTEKCLNKTTISINKNNKNEQFDLDEHLNEQMCFGLKVIWDIMQDKQYNEKFPMNTQQKIECILCCVDSIKEILSANGISDILRRTVITLCIRNISKSESIFQTLDLLLKLFQSNNPYKERYNHLLRIINKEENIILYIVKDLDRYIRKVNSIESENENKNKDNSKIVYEGYYSHFNNIMIRLMTIFMLIQRERGITLDFNIFENLWTICNINPLAKSTFLNMLKDNIKSIPYKLFEDIYLNIMLNEEKFPIDNINSYELFENMFNEFYFRKNKFLIIPKDIRISYYSGYDLTGIERFWNLLVNIKDKKIQQKVASLLSNLCLNTNNYEDNSTKQHWKKFIEKIIQLVNRTLNEENALRGVILLLKKIYYNNDNQGPMMSENDIKVIESSADKSNLCIYSFTRGKDKDNKDENFKSITQIISVFNNSLFYHTRAKLSYVFQIPMNKIYIQFQNSNFFINMNKDFEYTNSLFKNYFPSREGEILKKTEMTFFVYQDEPPLTQIPQNPKTLILTSPFLISILGNLLRDKNKPYISDIWALIKDRNKLKEKKNNFEDEWAHLWIINDDNKSDESKEGFIKEIDRIFDFDNTSIYYNSFILSKIYNLISLGDKTFFNNVLNKSIIWKDKIHSYFIKFSLTDKQRSEMTDEEIIEKLGCLLYLIEMYFFSYHVHKITEEKEILVKRMTQFLIEIFTIANDKNNDKKEIIEQEIKVNKSLTSFIQKDTELRNIFINYCMHSDEMKGKIVYLLIECSINSYNTSILQSFSPFLCAIMESFKPELDEIEKKLIIEFTHFIISNCLSTDSIKIIKDAVNKSNDISKEIKNIMEEFFELISIFIQKSFIIFETLTKDNPLYFDYDSFINNTALPLILHSKKDNISEILISGLMRIIYEISLNHDINFIDVSQNNSQLDFASYIMQSLFISECNDISLSQQSQRLTSSIGLKSAFHLLILLLYKREEQNFDIISKMNIYHNISWGESSKDNKWQFSKSQNIKIGKFVGLKNLGCTCYMNSLFQIFFNMPAFRESIIQCECTNERKNSLHQLKKVFSYLKYFDCQFCEASEFCANFDDEILKTNEQMDIDEFFVLLLDKIENRLKGTQNENVIKYFFQGKNSDDLDFQGECGHKRENELSFYSIQLQVKNKKNIEESLDALIEGEVMDGDNSIYCEVCQNKIPAIKRQMFKVLPRTLLFVLKRFEFNYTEMKKIKLNDYYEFPLELDMTKYTKEFIINKQSNKNNKYKLKAIVIHIGSSDGGHYYDFIRDDESNEWYEFNDEKIEKFDIANLKKECFGGKEQFYSKISKKMEEKDIVKNAYLLFYEKEDISDCEQFDKFNVNPNCSDVNLQYDNKEIIEKITQKMIFYYFEKLLFSKEYHMFILEFLLNYLNVEYFDRELVVFLKQFSKTQSLKSNKILDELRETPSFGSNLENYLKNGKIKLISIKDKKNKSIQSQIINIFEELIVFFFKIALHSEDKTYLTGTVDLIKFCINKYNGCAEFILEEFSNIDVMIEYLIGCPYSNIKLIIVGLLNCAMVKLQIDRNNNKDNEKDKDIDKVNTISVNNDSITALVEVKENEDKNAKDDESLKQESYTIVDNIQDSSSSTTGAYYQEASTKIPTNNSSDVQRKNDKIDNIPDKSNSFSTDDNKEKNRKKLNLMDSKNFPKETIKIINNAINILIHNDLKENCNFIYYLIYRFTQLSKDAINHIINYYSEILNYLFQKLIQNNQISLYFTSNEIQLSSEHCILSLNIGIKSQWHYSSSYNSGNSCNNYALLLLYNLLLTDRLQKQIFCQQQTLFDIMKVAQTKQAALAHTKVMNKFCFNNSDFTQVYIEIFMAFFEKREVYNYQYIMLTFRYFMLNAKDSMKDERIKSTLKEYFKTIFKNKNIYSFMSFHTKFILKLFNQKEMIKGQYIDIFKDNINFLIKWFKENPIPPEIYEIKGLRMYRRKELQYNPIPDKMKKEFNDKAEKETKEIIELLNDLFKKDNRKYLDYLIAKNENDSDIDITDFKFIAGDIVSYKSQKFKVEEFTEEVLKLEIIKNKEYNKQNPENQKQSTIWVETNDKHLSLIRAISYP